MQHTPFKKRAFPAAAGAPVVVALVGAIVIATQAGWFGNEESVVARQGAIEADGLKPRERQVTNVPASQVTSTRVPAAEQSNALLQHGQLEPLATAAAPRLVDVYLDAGDTERLLERQASINIWLDAVASGTTPPDGSTRFEAMISLTRQSVLAIMDAERRGAKQLSAAERAEPVKNLEHRFVLDKESAYRVWSGGQVYEIPHGEFPLFDMLCIRANRSKYSVSEDSVPLDDLFALANKALLYRPR